MDLPVRKSTGNRVTVSRNISTSVSLTMLKPLTVQIITNCRKITRQEYRPSYLSLEKPVCRSRSLFGTTDCSKLRKEYKKAANCHPVYLTYMQSTSYETHWAR